MKRLLTALAAFGLLITPAPAEFRVPGSPAPAPAGQPGQPPQKKILNVCAGDRDGVYFAAANYFASQTSAFLVRPVITEGALENAQKVSQGLCQFGFSQADAIRAYREMDAQAETNVSRVMGLYPEYVHLICNRDAKIGKLTDLRKGNVVAIGAEGSGTRAVWEAIKTTDKKKWEEIGVSKKSGLDALMAVQDGDEVTCAIITRGLGTPLLKKDAQRLANKITLVNVNESVDGVKDAKGKPIYTYQSIPSGTYGGLMPKGMLFGHNDAQTFSVDAVFIGNQQWIDQNKELYKAVLAAINNSLPKIVERTKN